MVAAVDLVEILGSPVWQGIGALIAILTAASAIYVRWGRSSRSVQPEPEPKDRQSIKSIDLSQAGGVEEFYEEFLRTVSVAKERVYRSGNGFAGRSPYLERLLQAEKDALIRGTHITRIQTSSRVLDRWAEGLADNMSQYPEHIEVFADFDRRVALDFGLVDPYGENSLVCLFVEDFEPTTSGTRSRPSAAVFFYNHRSLAKAVAEQFMVRVRALSQMSPADVRVLAGREFYFAYGPHMLARHMQQFASDAVRCGPARLPGWSLKLAMTPLPGSVSARIEPTGGSNDSVDGVVYELSTWEKRRLLSLEHGAYREVPVSVKQGTRRLDAFAIVHDVEDPTDPLAQPADLLLMIEGAEENHYGRLVDRLHRLRAEVMNNRVIPGIPSQPAATDGGYDSRPTPQ